MEYLKHFEHAIWSSDFNLSEMAGEFLCSQLGIDLPEEIKSVIEQGTMMHTLKHLLRALGFV